MKYLLICITLFFAQQATAAVTINIIENGGNVEVTMSGSVNLNATGGLAGTAVAYNGYIATTGGLAFTSGPTEFYSIDVGTWTPFGNGGIGNWNSSSGDALVMFTDPVIAVPTGYVSGNPLSATATKNGATFATLGFTPGTYVTTLTNGAVTDTVTVIIESSSNGGLTAVAIPVNNPLVLLFLTLLLGGLGWRSLRHS